MNNKIKKSKFIYDSFKELPKIGEYIDDKYLSAFIYSLCEGEERSRLADVKNPYSDSIKNMYEICDDIEIYWLLCIGVGIEHEMSLWFSSWDEVLKVYHYEPDPLSIYHYALTCLELDTSKNGVLKQPFIWHTCLFWYKYLWNNDL